MRKRWIVWYFGALGNLLFTGKMTKRQAKKWFKETESAFVMEKSNGWFQKFSIRIQKPNFDFSKYNNVMESL